MASNHVARVTAGGLTNAHVAHSLYGYCTTAAATVEKAVSLYSDGTTAGGTWNAADLFHGLTITVRFQYANTATNPTLNVNGTGAKPIYRYGTTVPSTNATNSWNNQSVVTLTYDTLLNTSGCWVLNNWLNNNSTYSNASLGTGYAVQTNTASAAACTANFSNGTYTLTTNGIVAVRFLYDVPANATLNINSKGAKAIYYKNAAIKANIITAGDTATFAYNNSYYHLISIDNAGEEVAISSTEPTDTGTKIWIKI